MTTSILIQACQACKEWSYNIPMLFGLHFAHAAEGIGARTSVLGIMDIVTYAALFILIGVIAWLSQREIKKSIDNYSKVTSTLRTERDTLEIRLSKRTTELLDVSREKNAELQRIARFGELSQGLFHDLMNPLASLSLYVEKLALRGEHMEDTGPMIKKMVASSERMRSFMDSVKRCLGNATSIQGAADLQTELSIARDILAYKARMANVQLIIEKADSFLVNIHPVRIHQVFVNLISNAIEACMKSAADGHEPKEGLVNMSITNKRDHAIIEIKDNGCGIPDEIKENIFSPSFSTKASGLGIGLSTVSSIVEDELRGSITVESFLGSGTSFTIKIPRSTDIS